MAPHPSPSRLRARGAATMLAVAAAIPAVLDTTVRPAGAASDTGAAVVRPVTPSRYRPPVDAPVRDAFRLPLGPYGPGNRGLEYETAVGATVTSIGTGTVAFAGQVAGRLVISIDHPDGLRSSLVGLSAISVAEGDRVVAGEPVGRAGDRLHLGVRRAGVYLDPALLFGARGPARLVPLGRALGVVSE